MGLGSLQGMRWGLGVASGGDGAPPAGTAGAVVKREQEEAGPTPLQLMAEELSDLIRGDSPDVGAAPRYGPLGVALGDLLCSDACVELGVSASSLLELLGGDWGLRVTKLAPGQFAGARCVALVGSDYISAKPGIYVGRADEEPEILEPVEAGPPRRVWKQGSGSAAAAKGGAGAPSDTETLASDRPALPDDIPAQSWAECTDSVFGATWYRSPDWPQLLYVHLPEALTDERPGYTRGGRKSKENTSIWTQAFHARYEI